MPWEYDTSLNAVANHEIGAVLFSKEGYSDGIKNWEIRWNKEVFRFKTSDLNEWPEENGQNSEKLLGTFDPWKYPNTFKKIDTYY